MINEITWLVLENYLSYAVYLNCCVPYLFPSNVPWPQTDYLTSTLLLCWKTIKNPLHTFTSVWYSSARQNSVRCNIYSMNQVRNRRKKTPEKLRLRSTPFHCHCHPPSPVWLHVCLHPCPTHRSGSDSGNLTVRTSATSSPGTLGYHTPFQSLLFITGEKRSMLACALNFFASVHSHPHKSALGFVSASCFFQAAGSCWSWKCNM